MKVAADVEDLDVCLYNIFRSISSYNVCESTPKREDLFVLVYNNPLVLHQISFADV